MSCKNNISKSQCIKYDSLQELLESNKVVVFKGIRVGGILSVTRSIPITNETPCTSDFSDVYSENIVSDEEFLTIVPDKKRGPGAYFYQNDFTQNNNEWFRDTGAAFLISNNELLMNSGQGTTNRLVFSDDSKDCKCGNKMKRISLYIGSESFNNNNDVVGFQPFSIFSYNVSISSEAERDSKVPCNAFCHKKRKY
jgi:hypothetical protein